MSDLANNAKVTVLWRGVVGISSILATAGIGISLSLLSSLIGKVNTTQNDVAQIKWELPVIKENAAKDKAEVIRQITAMEERIQAIRSLGDSDRRELNELKLHVALLKQKLQLP